MKRILLLFLALAASPFFAQAQAPDSLRNKQIFLVALTGTGSFAASGTALRSFGGGAHFFTNFVVLAPDISGTYTYSKLSTTVGEITFTETSGRSYSTTLTFLSSTVFNFVSAFGADRQTGSGLLVDATPSPLLNISTRIVLTAGQVLNPGFVVGGPAPRRVLIRAVGPTLGTAFGVPNVLATPSIAVFSGQTQIASNSGWGGNAQLSAAFAMVGAFSLPTTSRDAALLLTLNPGAYTAQIGGGAGDVLLEVYFVE